MWPFLRSAREHERNNESARRTVGLLGRSKGRPWLRYLCQRPIRPPRGLGVLGFFSVVVTMTPWIVPPVAAKDGNRHAGFSARIVERATREIKMQFVFCAVAAER
jgi:hypothetical protein